MKVLVKYTTTTYGCQKNSEGVQSDWQSGGEDSQIIELEPDPTLTLKVQAIKEIKQPYQFSNSITIYTNFKIEILD